MPVKTAPAPAPAAPSPAPTAAPAPTPASPSPAAAAAAPAGTTPVLTAPVGGRSDFSLAAHKAAIAAKNAGVEVDTTPPAAAGTTVEAAGAAPSAAEAPPTPDEQREQRRRYLDASRAERRAKLEQRKAADLGARAAAFQEATGTWEQDPARMLQAAGIDPRKFYQRYTEQILGGNAPAPPDPVAAKVQEALAPYMAAMEHEQATRAESHAIAAQVLPLCTGEAAPELLVAMHGGEQRAALAVWNEVKAHYERTGEIVPFNRAIEILEAQLADTLEKSIEGLQKTKRFAPRFAVVQPARYETRTLTRTLTRQASAPTREATPTRAKPQSKKDWIELAVERAAAKEKIAAGGR